MATTKGKEVRTLSKSKSLITPHSQRTTRQNIPGSTERDKSSNSAEKQRPGYLKPTAVTSRTEPVRPAKKVLGVEDQKLLRRRSFDRPPSTIPRVQKALVSPGPRERLIPREKPVTLRSSSSFPAKPNNAPKSISDRAVKAPQKTVRSSTQPVASIASRGLKTKSITPAAAAKKKASPSAAASASKKVPVTCEDLTETLDLGTTHDDKESLINEDEEILNVADEVEVPEVENFENGAHFDHNVDTDAMKAGEEDKSNTSCDISTVEEDNITQETGHTDEIEEKIQIEHETEENHINVDDEVSDSTHHEESPVEEAKVEAEDKEEENVNQTNEKATSSGDTGDDDKIEAKLEQEDEEGSKEVKPKEAEVETKKEAEEVERSIEEAKPEEVNVSATKQQAGQGKKESPGAYNDVIEETASKLLEKRKNKVKALVGAFETVIDYESAASK